MNEMKNSELLERMIEYAKAYGGNGASMLTAERYLISVIDRQEAQSGELAAQVRKAVNRLLDSEMENAIRLIEENRASIDALVERLLADNHLSGDEIRTILETAAQRTADR